MKKQLVKQLYKKNPKLALQVAKVLGYRVVSDRKSDALNRAEKAAEEGKLEELPKIIEEYLFYRGFNKGGWLPKFSSLNEIIVEYLTGEFGVMSKDAAASYISKRYKMDEFGARKLYDELQNFKAFTE